MPGGRTGPKPPPQAQAPLAPPARAREATRPPPPPRHHHHGQPPRLTSENPVSQPEGNLPTRGPGRPRHDTPPSAIPSERKLPTVTKNGNYPHPVKHLKPLVLVPGAARLSGATNGHGDSNSRNQSRRQECASTARPPSSCRGLPAAP